MSRLGSAFGGVCEPTKGERRLTWAVSNNIASSSVGRRVLEARRENVILSGRWRILVWLWAECLLRAGFFGELASDFRGRICIFGQLVRSSSRARCLSTASLVAACALASVRAESELAGARALPVERRARLERRRARQLRKRAFWAPSSWRPVCGDCCARAAPTLAASRRAHSRDTPSAGCVRRRANARHSQLGELGRRSARVSAGES